MTGRHDVGDATLANTITNARRSCWNIFQIRQLKSFSLSIWLQLTNMARMRWRRTTLVLRVGASLTAKLQKNLLQLKDWETQIFTTMPGLPFNCLPLLLHNPIDNTAVKSVVIVFFINAVSAQYVERQDKTGGRRMEAFVSEGCSLSVRCFFRFPEANEIFWSSLSSNVSSTTLYTMPGGGPSSGTHIIIPVSSLLFSAADEWGCCCRASIHLRQSIPALFFYIDNPIFRPISQFH